MAKKKDKKTPPQKRAPLNQDASQLAAMLEAAKAPDPAPAPRQPQPQKKVVKGKTDLLGSNDAVNKLVKPMTQEEITATLQKIENGTKFRVQYKQSATGDTIYLFSMLKNGVLSDDHSYLGLVKAIYLSNSWDSPTNRIFNLKAVRWSKGWIGRFERAIEAIEILS